MMSLLTRRPAGVVLGAAILGAGLAALLAVQTPSRYVSAAVVNIPASQSIRDLTANVLGANSLREVIEKEDLYRHDRERVPMEDVLQEMRRAIEFRSLDSADLWAIRFTYEEAKKAQRATGDLLDKASAAMPELAIVRSPALPPHAEPLTHPEIVGLGCLSGLCVGFLVIGLQRSARIRLVAAGALSGAALAGTISICIPPKYVSEARLSVSSVPGLNRAAASGYYTSIWTRALDGGVLAGIANSPALSLVKKTTPPQRAFEELRKRIVLTPVNKDEFSIAVMHRDPAVAQAINRMVITKLVEESVLLRRETLAKSTEPPAAVSPHGEVDGVIPEGQGRLRTRTDGIDAVFPSSEADSHTRAVDLWVHFPPAEMTSEAAAAPDFPVEPPTPVLQNMTPKPQTAIPPNIPRLEVIEPASLPDTSVGMNRLDTILLGLAAGSILALVASLFPGILPGNHYAVPPGVR